MKRRNLIWLMLFLLLWACSEPGKPSDAENKVIAEAHERITQNSILAEFIDRLTNDDFEKASALLHPELRDAWAFETFAADWKAIREQLSEEWGPEPTGSLTGVSPQGPWDKATFRLSSDWRSLTTIELFSKTYGDQDYIFQVLLRVPYRKFPPDSVLETSERLVDLFFDEQFKAIEELMTNQCKQQFPEALIKQLRPVLGDDKARVEKHVYRFFANTVWYDAIRLNYAGDGFTFIEFIFSSENGQMKVETLTFRG
jgi:hypothetical protein